MRGKPAIKRVIKPDAKFKSTMVSKLINRVMISGKRRLSTSLVYEAMDMLAEATKEKSPLAALEKAFDNVRPRVEVRSRRVGGSNYQVPMPVPEERQFSLATRWLLQHARDGRAGKPFAASFARELIAAYNNEGGAVRKKEEVKRMADANKAFAQFA